MLNRIFIGITLIVSLAWIGYVALDIFNETNNYDPEFLFGITDEKLLIINRPEEVSVDVLPDFANAPLSDVYRSLNATTFASAYLSANQAHLLLKKPENWSAASIKELFNGSEVQPEIESGSFSAGSLQGRYYKKALYIYRGEIARNTKENAPYVYDKRASASVIHLAKEDGVKSVTDIYFRGNERIDYVTYNDDIQQGKQVKDEVLFAGIVTSNFSRYHFFERDYYAGIDSVFAQGPMYRWMQNGFLELEYEGANVLISDYIDGQDPVLVLNDLSQTQDEERFDHRLTSDFPSGNRDYYVKYLEDLVVIAEDSSICDKIIGDFKLGNTIALNKAARFRIYGSLPRSVSERIVTKDHSSSKAVYNGKLLETQMGVQTMIADQKPNKKSLALNCGFDVLDFAVLPRDGNVVAVGKKGEITRFKDGKLSWSKRVKGEILGGVQLIDLYQTGERFVLVNTKDEIHLWNLNGDEIPGFPVKFEQVATLPVKFYRWEGQSYFLQVTEENEVLHFDSKGRELNVIKLSLPVTRPVDVWASQHTLFAGFANDRNFVMYNLDNNKAHREFQLPTACAALKVPNELFQYGMDNGTLFKLSQKGIRHNYQSFQHARLLGIQQDGRSPIIIIQAANEVHLLNPEGIPFSHINLPFNEIGDVFVQTFESGKTTTAIIDGLENNVYLYALDGVRLKHEPMEGQTKVVLSSEANTTIVTTVVDQFIVQYFEN